MTQFKSKGRGNSEYSPVDMSANRYWTRLNYCTCDDSPYTDACKFCLCERGDKGYGYTDEQVLSIINPKKEKADDKGDKKRDQEDPTVPTSSA